MTRNFIYAFLLLFLFAAAKLQAQTKPDSNLTETERSAVSLYNKSVGDRLGLYRGPAVVPYALRSNGTPNFRDTLDYFEDGTVNYDNRMYYHVPLIYNTERDMLQSRVNNGAAYTLLSDRVVYFDLLGRHFIRVNTGANDKNMTAGFYEILYNGKVQILARHTKIMQTQTSGRTAMATFSPQTTYFLKRGAIYSNVDSKSKFLNALSDKKKELQQYIKDNRLDFSENPVRSMDVLAAYYDRLTN